MKSLATSGGVSNGYPQVVFWILALYDGMAYIVNTVLTAIKQLEMLNGSCY